MTIQNSIHLMPELRNDWLTGRSVIVAENRALRPNEFDVATARSPEFEVGLATSIGKQNVANLALAEVGLTGAPGVPSCPFCPGNESLTPPAVLEQTNEQGQWQLRVVPNKFPALSFDDEHVESAAEPALGVHEVFVESRRHVDRVSAISVQELRNVLQSYAARLRHWRDHDKLAYGLIFKNHGPRAGASLAHLHSQLIALPAIPRVVEAELQRAREAYGQSNICPYCRLIDDERTSAARMVLDRDGYVAFCPYASLQPHEVWLMPARHTPSFEQVSDGDSLEALAGVLHAVISRLEKVIPAASYNMLLRTAPWRVECRDLFHWRIELLPRTTSIAGLEIATGVFINPLAPEHAARQLRPT
jgi:UDPglucose--hexose-1-phosphate uridylyltransferase